MKKLLCFLAVTLSVVMMAAGVYAEATEVYEENGDYTTFTIVEKQPCVLGAAKLSTPKNLKWNPNSKYGVIQWDVVSGCEGEYYIEVLCNGEEVFSTTWSGLYNNGSGVIELDVVFADVFTKSGNYTFSVQALGDGYRYSDSSIAYSGTYKYVLPSSKLSTPSNLVWNDEGYLTHSAVKNAGGYEYYIYNQNKECVGTTSYVDHEPITDMSNVSEQLGEYLIEICSWEENIEAFYITVFALPYNIEKYQCSAESAFSRRIPVSEIGEQVSGDLEDLLNDALKGNISADQALSGFISGMENKGTTTVELAMNMQQDPSLVTQLAQLEDLYSREKGIDLGIRNQTTGDYLEQHGIDVGKLSIVGAALNSDGSKEVSINFSDADPSVSADELFYKNSVAVDISMDGVQDVKNLAVPVQIKMPVPTGIVPERLVILHYHADGSMDEIRPSISNEWGQSYATFVLTSFSTFVFCNEEEATVNVKINSASPVQMTGGSAGSIFAVALYDDEGNMKDVQLAEPSENMNIVFSNTQNGDYAKIMWWESRNNLKPVCESEIVYNIGG